VTVMRMEGKLTLVEPKTEQSRRTVNLPTVARAKLPAIRLHDLRHSAASLMLAQGASAKEVQAMLGHTTITTTMDVYAHLMDEARQESAQCIMGCSAWGKSSSRNPVARVDAKGVVPVRGIALIYGLVMREKKWLGRRDSNPTYLIQSSLLPCFSTLYSVYSVCTAGELRPHMFLVVAYCLCSWA